MLTITLQDLRFRARQFVIAVIGAGLVFAMTLLLSGIAAGFGVEINQTVQGFGAQSWVLAASTVDAGIADLSPIPESSVSLVSHSPGVRLADPLIVVPQAARIPGRQTQHVNLIGYRPGGLGGPGEAIGGHSVTGSGQVVVDAGMNLGVGRTFIVSGHTFQVVGVVSGRTLLGGTPNAYVTLRDAQDVVFGGGGLIDAVVTTGVPRAAPVGYGVYTNDQIEKASLRDMSSGISSINNSRIFMWIIAAVIVAALVYVSALERTRDFAVLKALGSSTRLLFAGLAVQAVAVAIAAAVFGAVLSNFMTGIFGQPVDIPISAFVVLPLSALVVGLIASLAALGRVASVDPAAAFGGP